MTQILLVVGTFLTSFAGGLVIIPRILSFCRKRGLYDLPDARKRHTAPVPRLGGVCFLPCMGISFALAALAIYMSDGRAASVSVSSVLLLAGVVVVYAVGVVDDLVGVCARNKFAVQIVSACVLPLGGMYINNLYGFLGFGEIPFYVGMPLTVFLVVAIENAMNLIDGIDGLCAGLSVIALAGYGLMFASLGFWVFCVVIAGLAGVVMAYSYFNLFRPSRKIFMGDSGSLTLGFLLAVFFVKLSMDNPQLAAYDARRMVVAASFLVVPCLDVARVMLRRRREGRPLFSPDRNHIHHRLIDAGLTPHRALAVILALALFFVAVDALLVWLGVQCTWVAAADVALFWLFHQGVKRHGRGSRFHIVNKNKLDI